MSAMLWGKGRPAMGPPQKEPLRVLTSEEQVCLERIARAGSERVDRARRARALLAVAAGRSFAQAAVQAGLRSPSTVAHPVERVHLRGVAALTIAGGRGPEPPHARPARGAARGPRPP